jgi:hypothetical protein
MPSQTARAGQKIAQKHSLILILPALGYVHASYLSPCCAQLTKRGNLHSNRFVCSYSGNYAVIWQICLRLIRGTILLITTLSPHKE